MNKFLMIGVVAATIGGASVTAEAMPVNPVGSAFAPAVTDVSFGCGPYRHPSPRGFCVPNRPPVYFGGPRYRGGPYRDRFYGRRWR